jgi:hypothetical protein
VLEQHLSLPLRPAPKLDGAGWLPQEPAEPIAILICSWIGIASIRARCSKRSGNGVPHRTPSRQFGPSSARCKLHARMLLSWNTSSSPASAYWPMSAQRRRGQSSSRCFDVRSAISFGTKSTRGSPDSDRKVAPALASAVRPETSPRRDRCHTVLGCHSHLPACEVVARRVLHPRVGNQRLHRCGRGAEP